MPFLETLGSLEIIHWSKMYKSPSFFYFSPSSYIVINSYTRAKFSLGTPFQTKVLLLLKKAIRYAAATVLTLKYSF